MGNNAVGDHLALFTTPGVDIFPRTPGVTGGARTFKHNPPGLRPWATQKGVNNSRVLRRALGFKIAAACEYLTVDRILRYFRIAHTRIVPIWVG